MARAPDSEGIVTTGGADAPIATVDRSITGCILPVSGGAELGYKR